MPELLPNLWISSKMLESLCHLQPILRCFVAVCSGAWRLFRPDLGTGHSEAAAKGLKRCQVPRDENKRPRASSRARGPPAILKKKEKHGNASGGVWSDVLQYDQWKPWIFPLKSIKYWGVPVHFPMNTAMMNLRLPPDSRRQTPFFSASMPNLAMQKTTCQKK